MNKYFGDIFKSVWSVLVGMKVTFLHLFTPAVTIQYPDVKLKLPERARNRLYVNMDDCIGCFQCDMACPVNCFKIETVKSMPTEDLGLTSTGQKKRLWVTEFDIDIAKCCYCGLCVYPCPTECIKMTDVYEFSEYDRVNLIYNYATMDAAEGQLHTANAKKDEERLAAERAKQAEEKAKTAAANPPAAAPQAPPPPSAGGVKPPPFAAKPGGIKPPPFKAG